jgi:hypothetical protein
MAERTDVDAREVEALRARVAELEQELAETQARANQAIARAQERNYWLDRWGIDLNELMRSPWADRLRSLARLFRR